MKGAPLQRTLLKARPESQSSNLPVGIHLSRYHVPLLCTSRSCSFSENKDDEVRKGKEQDEKLTRPQPTLKQEAFQRNEERAWPVLMADAE